jgi:hypothetical protein
MISINYHIINKVNLSYLRKKININKHQIYFKKKFKNKFKIFNLQFLHILDFSFFQKNMYSRTFNPKYFLIIDIISFFH